MSSKSGPGSYDGSGNRSPESSRGRQRDGDRPWLKRSRSRSPSPRSRSRSPRHRSHRSRSPPPHIRPINNKDPKYLNSRVFVANIASDKATDDDLHSLFGKHGKVIGKFMLENPCNLYFVRWHHLWESQGEIKLCYLRFLMSDALDMYKVL